MSMSPIQPIQPEWLGQRPGPLPVTPCLAAHMPLEARIGRVANEFGCRAVWYDRGDIFGLVVCNLRNRPEWLALAVEHLQAEGYSFTQAEIFARWEDGCDELRLTRQPAERLAA